MLHFISFGSGSSGNCYYLFTDHDTLLIDAGIGLRALKKGFRDLGKSLSDIHNLIITHDHADHVKSVGSLSRDYGLDVYATKRVHEGIEGNYCVRCKISCDHVKTIEKGKTFTLGDFTITPFGVPHDSFDNVGYLIVAGEVNFVLITDIGHVTDEIKHFISVADYLVIEANHDVEMLMQGNYPQYLKHRILSDRGHLSNEDCANAIAENATPRLKHVWLCHLSEENNHPVLAQKTVEHVLREKGIVAGVDFKLDVLKRKHVSEIFDLL